MNIVISCIYGEVNAMASKSKVEAVDNDKCKTKTLLDGQFKFRDASFCSCVRVLQ